jgi:hypothetical protein
MKRPRPGPHNGPKELKPIRADELLPWSALYDRLGWGAAALAEARCRGLRVLRFARRQYVTGAEVIRFLQSVDDDNQAGGTHQDSESGGHT